MIARAVLGAFGKRPVTAYGRSIDGLVRALHAFGLAPHPGCLADSRPKRCEHYEEHEYDAGIILAVINCMSRAERIALTGISETQVATILHGVVGVRYSVKEARRVLAALSVAPA